MLRENLVSGPDEAAEVMMTSNESDVVKAMGEETDPTENWDLSKVDIVYDPTGIPVPVPKGWTASSVESERYVNGLNVEKQGTLTDLTFSSRGEYPWIQNDDGVWISGNYNVHNSKSELVSDEIIVGADGGYLSIEWSVSSEERDNYEDVLSITITNIGTGTSEKLYSIRGTNYGREYSTLKYPIFGTEIEEGKYVVSINYSKNGSNSYGLDRGYVKGGTILNYDDIGSNTVMLHKYGGFVIYEGEESINDENAWEQSKIRNQFVWIPVTDTSRIYKANSEMEPKRGRLWTFSQAERLEFGITKEPGVMYAPSQDSFRNLIRVLNLQYYTKDVFYKELQIEFDKSMESIDKYGGFYIGRYETGNVNSENLVVKRLQTDLSGSWYDFFYKMKKISNNENIQISIIWGCLFDETLQWLIETGEKTLYEVCSDSTMWGNYYASGFSYFSKFQTWSNKRENSATLIPTGSSEMCKANNIYDLSGNITDATMEGDVSSAKRIARGGCYRWNGAFYPAYHRIYSEPNYNSGMYLRMSSIFLHQMTFDI